MTQYVMRLDDASEYMDVAKWERMERLLECYKICPIVGIIPDNQDQSLTEKYERDFSFWKKADRWIAQGWVPALHGCEHRYVTSEGGINPINSKSEFAGLPYEEQEKKIKRGWKTLKRHRIEPEIFFAPAHTFDQNTLEAIKNTTSIRIISDTIAGDVYKEGNFWFIPQQSGRVRKIGWPCKVVTFCYHPNTMENADYKILEEFLKKNGKQFVTFGQLLLKNRRFGVADWILRKAVFIMRKVRRREEMKKEY